MIKNPNPKKLMAHSVFFSVDIFIKLILRENMTVVLCSDFIWIVMMWEKKINKNEAPSRNIIVTGASSDCMKTYEWDCTN